MAANTGLRVSSALAGVRRVSAGPLEGAIIDQDAYHLQLLSVFHYVAAALAALGGCVPFLHVAMGIAILSGAFETPGQPSPPAFLGWFIIGMAAVFIMLAWTMSIAVLLAARNLARHKAHTYCLVVAAIECLFVPVGTALGVFAIIVLMRPSVRRLFGAGHESGASGPATLAD